MTHVPPADDILTSQFAHDAEMAELLEMFISELPDRVTRIRQATTRNEVNAVSTMAHQLKGAAPGYGYPTIGEAAARIERQLREDATAGLSSVRDDIDELLRLCEAAMNGASNA